MTPSPLSPSPQAPGPSGHHILRRLPSIGRSPLRFYRHQWQRYGDIVRFKWYGPFHAFMLCDPAAIERVMVTNAANYSKGFFWGRLRVMIGNGLFTSEGTFWRRQRRLSQPAFHRKRLEGMTGQMTGVAEELVERWHAPLGSGQAVEVSEEMLRVALEVVGRTLFSFDLTRRGPDLLAAFDECISYVHHRFNPFSLPVNVPTERNRRFLGAKNALNEAILEIIAARHARKTGEGQDDLLQLLMDARDEDTFEGMDDQQLLDEALTLMVAGHETTANTLAWAWFRLARHPEVREQMEAEIEGVLNGRTPTLEDLPRLAYTRRVVEETLRFYPPIWVIGREALGDDVLGGFPIAARSSLAIVPYLVHRHPEYWDEPERFDPDRFLPENVAKRPKFAYFPFGGGPRLCMGREFALMETTLVLATVAQKMRLELVPGRVVVPQPGVSLRPKYGLHMTLHRR